MGQFKLDKVDQAKSESIDHCNRILQIDTLQQMSFEWKDPKDFQVKNNQYDGVAYTWQLKGYFITVQIAINPISWWEGYEDYHFEIRYLASEKASMNNGKTPSRDL